MAGGGPDRREAHPTDLMTSPPFGVESRPFVPFHPNHAGLLKVGHTTRTAGELLGDIA